MNKRAVEASEEQRPVPDIRTGDVVQIRLVSSGCEFSLSLWISAVSSAYSCSIDFFAGSSVQEVPENRRRLSVYKGIVISRQNAGIHTTIRIRRIIAGVGVEIVFPL